MTVTVNVNNLSLCHKASGGMSAATLPDVCKTPSVGGQPMPYPNIAWSTDIANGTRTVSADGGNMCANYGSQFNKSTGDELGTLGGIISGTFLKEATWITYSFDVKLEGKGACRLTDKMFHNHQNTVNMSGLLQITLQMARDMGDILFLCYLLCESINEGNPTQRAVEDKLNALDVASGGNSPYKAEVPYNMRQSPPAHIPKEWKFPDYLDTRWFRDPYRPRPEPVIQSMRDYGSGNRPGDIKIPDVTVLANPSAPPEGANIRSIVEMKMPGDPNPFGSTNATDQVFSYERIATQDGQNPDGKVIQLDAVTCGCLAGTPMPKLVPELEKENERLKELRRVPQPAPLPSPPGWGLPSPSPAFVEGLSGAGLMLGGTALAAASGLATVVLAADDVTGIGVLDDPLMVASGAGVVGGLAIASKGAQMILHAFGF
jgi:hypothetical protein